MLISGCVTSPAGLGQVLEFMYTAKLSLSPDNVEDVLAVAGFLQMQEIVSACNALKSLSVPPENPQQPPEIGTYPPGFPSPEVKIYLLVLHAVRNLSTYAPWPPCKPSSQVHLMHLDGV